MLNTSINLAEWFELADLIAQLQNEDFYDKAFRLKEPWKQKAIEEIEMIKKGFQKIPFSIILK